MEPNQEHLPVGLGQGEDPTKWDGIEAISTRAVGEFIDWASRNIAFLEQGRSFGFELAVSPAVKDAIVLGTDRDTALRIISNLGDFQRRYDFDGHTYNGAGPKQKTRRTLLEPLLAFFKK